MLIVQSLWVGDKLGDLEVNAIKSHLRVGHIFILYVYNEVDNIPNGTIVKDGRDILDESYLDKGKDFGYYPFADIFRFNLLYKKGGFWVDLDLYATRHWGNLDKANEYIFSSERTIQKGAYRNRTMTSIPNIGVLKAPKNSVFYANLCLKIDSPNFKVTRRDSVMKEYRKFIDKYDMNNYVVPFHYFCPVDWWNAKEMFLDEDYIEKYGVIPMEKKDVLEKSYGIHFWRHILFKKKYYQKYIMTNNFGKKSLYKEFIY